MRESYNIRTHINAQAINETQFDVVAYEVGRACERVLAAAQRDPAYYSNDIEISVSIGPPAAPLAAEGKEKE